MHIHAYAAYLLELLAVYHVVGGIAYTAGMSVRIARCYNGGANGLVADKGSSVAYGCAGGQIAYLSHPGLEGQHGLELALAGLAVGVHAVEYYALANHVEVCLRVGEYGRGIAGVAYLRAQPLCCKGIEDGCVVLELPRGVFVLGRGIRHGEVGKHALDGDAGYIVYALDGIGGCKGGLLPLGEYAGAAHAGVYLYVYVQIHAGLGSVPAELQCCALVLHGLGDIVFGKGFSILFGGIAQYEYGLGYAALPKLYSLGQAGYREEVCALLFQEKAAVYRSVAVCVGLYDAEHLLAGALGYFKVVLQCRHVYFRPGAGLRVNIAHVEPPCIFC